jgi:very-short-patch-repair endonuclease
MTLPEKILWQFLRGSAFAGLRFRRQHPIGHYIADFCCPSRKLVIELDGEYHMNVRQADKNREDSLQEHGFRVLRFTNDHVFERVEWILQTIADELSIDWHKNYHDYVACVKFPQKLYALLAKTRRHQVQSDEECEDGF